MNRNVKVQYLDPTENRTIIISDIHANLSAYQALLKKIHYIPNQDRLILNGDFIEKGDRSLETLRFIMNQVEKEDVYCTLGNCDFVCKNALYTYRTSFLKQILLSRKNSVLNEMADSIGLELKEDTDMSYYCQQLRKHYLKELAFVNDLPHVIEDDKTIIVHSALIDEKNYASDFKYIINQRFFLKENKKRFNKRVVVGHMPVSEYCTKIANFNCLYDAQSNVYSIDGGNVVKKSGQLNALILQGNTVSMDSYDDLPTAISLVDTNPVTPLPFFINWNEGYVTIEKEENNQYYVYNKAINRHFWMDKIFYEDHKATGFTNYEMPLKKGDIVKIVLPFGNRILIKKNGILGWTYLSNLSSK